MAYDVAAIRAHFPALAEGAAHFDAPGGTQTPDVVADAVRAALVSAVANRGWVTPAERRAEEFVAVCRAALADLLGADPRGIVFGRSATALTYDLSRALAKTWAPGDEVVVTRLDHDANVRPWVQAAAAVGATVRWVNFDPATGELPVEAVEEVLSPRTRLVATTAASNLIGTRPPVRQIAQAVHRVGALYWVDGVHATAHASVDVESLGADFWTCSPYKFMGPHCGVLAAAPALLETLVIDKLLPATDEVPERFELGTLPYELMAGTTAAVDFIASLAGVDTGSPGMPRLSVSNGDRPAPLAAPAPPPGVDTGSPRRTRILASMAAVEAHEDRLRARLESALRALHGIQVYSNAGARTPTMLFSIACQDPQDTRKALADKGINAPAGNFYALECSRHLGLGDEGGVRVGLAPYSSDDDIDRLIEALEQLT
ncbi:MAG: aminotransferase class V-fold PLP-dependent enzyme [Dermatophilaceae bacterium]